MVRPNGLTVAYEELGIGAVRVTIPWRRGRSRPNRVVGLYLHRVAMLIARGERVVLGVYGSPSQAPATRLERRRYCGFVAEILRRLPVRDVVIWNEANSPSFWPAELGAAGYEALLARCWDRLHGLRPNVNVISSTAAHYDAPGFARALGDAYRASGRSRPVVDTFGHNPYPAYAAEPPWAAHDDGTNTGEGDLARLLGAYRSAFAGTAQPPPGSGETTIWYLEDGFQTLVPQAKRRYYHGVENDPSALPAQAPHSNLSAVRDQATQLRDALLLAYCQPAVGAFFNFELIDEDRLSGWQSGLLWRDGTHKPSYDVFRDAVSAVSAGQVDCSTVPGATALPRASYRLDQFPLAHLGAAGDPALPGDVVELLPVPVL